MSGARKKRRLYVLLALTLLLAAFSLAAPALTPNDPNATDAARINQGPGAAYPLGTDRYGRCVCSRVMAGPLLKSLAPCMTFLLTRPGRSPKS